MDSLKLFKIFKHSDSTRLLKNLDDPCNSKTILRNMTEMTFGGGEEVGFSSADGEDGLAVALGSSGAHQR